MFGFVFGIIILLAGIGVGLGTYFVPKLTYKTDAVGRYIYDDDHNRILIKTYPYRRFTALAIIIGIILGLLIMSLGCITSVKTGYVGIVTTFGKVEDYTFDSGMHFKAPWNSVIQIDNKVQKTTNELSCFSSDIQEVNTIYTVNYQISKSNAQNLYRDIGTGYLETVINPTIKESVKTIIAKYTAENLIGKREILTDEIEVFLAENLKPYGIEVISTAIEDMDFTDSFTAAVEAKQVAAQNKLQAQIVQEQKTMEAEQTAQRTKIEANAQAEVAEIQAKADKAVAEINADSAEYQGKKEAAIALQRLASINGWTVVHNETTGINELYKANGTRVSDDELVIGTQRLIEYYYTQSWDGKLPETFVGNEDISSIIIDR